MQNVIAEIKRLAEAGIQEVVLTGIHLSSYGREIDGESHLIDTQAAIIRCIFPNFEQFLCCSATPHYSSSRILHFSGSFEHFLTLLTLKSTVDIQRLEESSHC